jgi:hypothetical protein
MTGNINIGNHNMTQINTLIGVNNLSLTDSSSTGILRVTNSNIQILNVPLNMNNNSIAAVDRIVGYSSLLLNDSTLGGQITISSSSVQIPLTYLDMNNNLIVNVAYPSSPNDATNKNYVDYMISTIGYVNYCDYVSYHDVPGDYNNFEIGIGATITGGPGPLLINDIAVSRDDRILLRAQGKPQWNGVYVVTDAGDPYILTRAVNYDSNEWISYGDFVFVISDYTLWYESSGKGSIINVGTDPITFDLLGYSNYIAGNGIQVSNN